MEVKTIKSIVSKGQLDEESKTRLTDRKKRKKFKKLTPRQRSEVVQKLLNQEKVSVIASEFGLTTSAVKYYARRFNIPLPVRARIINPNFTTIQIDLKVRQRLKEARRYERESYNETIKRLLREDQDQ